VPSNKKEEEEEEEEEEVKTKLSTTYDI